MEVRDQEETQWNLKLSVTIDDEFNYVGLLQVSAK